MLNFLKFSKYALQKLVFAGLQILEFSLLCEPGPNVSRVLKGLLFFVFCMCTIQYIP